MTLVDTSVWIDLFAGRQNAHVAKLEHLINENEDLCICGVVLMEVLHGIREKSAYLRTRDILLDLLFLPMDKQTFILAADIYRRLRSAGITIRNSIDCLIAAVCIDHDVSLLHNDRDFDRIARHFALRVL